MILFSLPLTVLAQGTKTVKGTVVDQNNEPIIGATVVVKGSTIGAATDLDGNYVLNGVPEDATLVFNYLGMLPQEISAAGQSVINVKLREDAQLLEEVVVIGYGSAKAKDLTAPIDVVKEKELINVPTSSPMAALQGKVPGVNIINSGTPGEGPKVTIRGMGSFGDTSPLYVVDGMFYDNINFLNNSDIQDMTILKDASASAIYGVRAANGVVIITTKKGSRNQDAKITYNGYVGIQKATNLLEMCNSHEYATMMLEANPEAYRSIFEKSVAEFGGNMENLQFNADTNWYDELLRTAMMTNHSLNISGGTEKATYSAGMSYLAQDGIMDVENYYRRLNFRAALDYEARKWLKVGFNGVFSNSQQQPPKNAAWQQAYNTPSIIPVYDDRRDDAVFPKKYTSPEQVGLTNNFNNPVATANYYDNRNETYQVLTNFYAQLNLIPDKLNIRSSYSYDYSMIRGSEFTPTYYVGTNQKKEVTELTKKNTNYYKYIWDNVATYTDKWGKHSFTGMLGASMRQEQYRLLEGTATNVPEGEDVWKYIALGNKEGATVKDDGWKYRGLSYFTRLNYNYNDKYMLMFTFRADGSSKYNDKWGYFPSIGAAWVISQEPFMKNQNIFDYMKLRASWGKLGNDKIAASAGFASIQNVQSVFGPNTAIDGFINTTNFSWLGWEGKTGDGDAACDDTGHRTGDRDGNGTLRACFQRIKDGVRGIAGCAERGLADGAERARLRALQAEHKEVDKPDRNGREDGIRGGVRHCLCAGGHEPDQQYQRQNQIAVTNQKLPLGKLISRDAVQTEFFCLQMHRDEDAGEIQNRRQNRFDRDLRIRNADILCHQECCCTHDRRHDLAAG